jgi:hypothetical protein
VSDASHKATSKSSFEPTPCCNRSISVNRSALMMMMMVMPFFVLRPWMVHIVDDQLSTVAHTFHAGRRVHYGFLAPAARTVMVMVVMVLTRVFRRRSRLVQVLPRLPIVPVQSAPALRPGRVQRSHRVRVR